MASCWDLGALTNAVLVHVGDQLGFDKAMTKADQPRLK